MKCKQEKRWIFGDKDKCPRCGKKYVLLIKNIDGGAEASCKCCGYKRRASSILAAVNNWIGQKPDWFRS